MKRISEPKNVALFEGLKVMSQRECEARAEIMHDHYSGYVEIEALAMLDMFKQHVIPSVKVRTPRSALARQRTRAAARVHAPACTAPCVHCRRLPSRRRAPSLHRPLARARLAC
jgi:glutamine synthetase type III